jgi:hypothetical protein
MVVCIVNANVQQNSTEKLLTISQGIRTSGLEKVNELKVARSRFPILALRECHR